MPMSLNLSRCSGGITSQKFHLSCFRPPSRDCKTLPIISSREPPSLLGALISPETVKARNSTAPIPTPELPHLALPRASPATCGNPLSARSGTVSRPRPKPRRNRTGPSRGRRVRSALGGGSVQIGSAPQFEDFESAGELSGLSYGFLNIQSHASPAPSQRPLAVPSPEAAALLPWQRPRAQARSRTRAPGLGA